MKVTIGLPVYNAEHTLADAVRSVFAQSFYDWELLIFDDGSSDGSPYIAQSIKDSRVKFFSDGKRRRLPYRLNQIARIASGKYLARMDADDLMHPSRLQEQVAYLDRHPETDIVDTGVIAIDENCVPWGKRGITREKHLPLKVLRKTVLNHATCLGRTSWFRANPYNESLARAQDRELWCRTYAGSNFAGINKPLYFVRESSHPPTQAYRDSCRYARKIASMHGDRMVGTLLTKATLLEYVLKEWLWNWSFLFSAKDIIMNHRNETIGDMEKRKALKVIQEIRKYPVPGFEFDSTFDENKWEKSKNITNCPSRRPKSST